MRGLRFFKELALQKLESDTDKQKVRAVQKSLEESMALDEKAVMRASYAGYLKNCPLEKNTILYEAFGGRGMICNPYAIFKYLLSCQKYDKWKHIWVIDDFEDNTVSMAEYRDMPNVKFVKYMSDEYLRVLAVSAYLINNVSFPGFFVKRTGQIYVNTWHGSPMKTMGFDIPGGNISSGNSARNLLSADYLISASPYMTEKAYLQSYKMRGIFEGTILENGFPRNDLFFHPDKEKTIKKLLDNGVCVDPDKKLILYAPTWKGEKYASPDTSLEEYFRLIESVQKSVDTEKYQILVKPHQIVYYYIKHAGGVTDQFIPATIDTNEILSIVDMLISDYSSIHFDFLVSGRPMVFFIPDLEEFTDYRGLYFSVDQLPGPVVKSYGELENYFLNLENETVRYEDKYKKEKQWAAPRDEGNACMLVADTVFGKKKSGVRVTSRENSKKKLLIYGGDFRDSEITSNLLAVLGVLDFQKLDVTVLVQSVKEEECEGNINRIPEEVRVLYWKPFYVADSEEYARHMLMENRSDDSKMCIPYAFYRRELKRAVGDALFDCVIAFSLDCSVFNGIFSVMNNTEKIIWMNQKWDKSGWIYEKADKIVAVNQDAFFAMGGTAMKKYLYKCRFIQNPVDLRRISRENTVQTQFTINHEIYYIASEIRRTDGMAELETVALPNPSDYNLVVWGELTEKYNYERLLEIFGELCKAREDIHLYFVGKGALRGKMDKMIQSKKLRSRVSFCGELKEPLSFIRTCDCMVLESEMGEQAQELLLAQSLGLLGISDYERLCSLPEKKEIQPYFDPKEYNHQIQRALEVLFEV